MVVKLCVKKNVLKNFQMSEQYWGCLDKMSEVDFSPAETLLFEHWFELENTLNEPQVTCMALYQKHCRPV